MIPAPTADNVDPVIRSGSTDFEQSAEPPEHDNEADTPSRIGDAMAIALGMLIGLLVFLALLIACFYEVSKAFGDQNAAGITETIVDLRGRIRIESNDGSAVMHWGWSGRFIIRDGNRSGDRHAADRIGGGRGPRVGGGGGVDGGVSAGDRVDARARGAGSTTSSW
ncbi:hypothetical protein [Nocardia sp. CA-145437]|uniref:hypothetical protein n=1 Tax=Nocardia sp. CA-145437 TaxID=3239980 RepID=UPI003D958ADE